LFEHCHATLTGGGLLGRVGGEAGAELGGGAEDGDGACAGAVDRRADGVGLAVTEAEAVTVAEGESCAVWPAKPPPDRSLCGAVGIAAILAASGGLVPDEAKNSVTTKASTTTP
jgi:hypothetical protein